MSRFFGPKLTQTSTTTGSDSHRLVKKIDNNAYDYGVPQTCHTTTTSVIYGTRTGPGSTNRRILDKKQQKYLEKFGRNLYQSKSIGDVNNLNNGGGRVTQQQQQRVTSDIFVFARKRPKLDCESNFDDVISVIDRNSGEYHHHHHQQQKTATSLMMMTPRTGSICVNECKSTVDGTAILRKVN